MYYKMNRKLVRKKKNHYIKETADNVFSTCLCIAIFKVMPASDEDHLRAFLFVTRTGGFPTRDATNGRWWCFKSYLDRVPRKQSLPNCTQHGDRTACVR